MVTTDPREDPKPYTWQEANEQFEDPALLIAQHFHEAYERLAPESGYETRKESAVAWEDVPENNRSLMR